MLIKISLAGATGWVGKYLVAVIHQSNDFKLVSAISPEYAQQNLGAILGIKDLDLIIDKNVTEALSKSDPQVLIDFTTPSAVKQNVLEALEHGIHVIIGTSGLTLSDLEEINELALKKNVGVIAAGNFSLTAALMKHFSTIAARFIPEWEIIDYGSASKPDAPSGTARELAQSLSVIRRPHVEVPIDETYGTAGARGADISGTRVHSIRLPSYILATESIFGMPHEKLIIRHEAGNSPTPYLAGVLLAIKKVVSTVGLTRGLDQILEL